MYDRFMRGVRTASLVMLAPAAVLAQGGRGAPGPQGGSEQGVPAIEKVSTTRHKATINGQDISYTANAGTMVIRDADGKPRATVFYIAYTRDGQNAATRPVTFFFNGGPGSASIWLNEGIMSPMHPTMGPGGAQPAPPYDLVPNQYSPLAATDLVQVDAMMTGYSRPAPGVAVSEFTGQQNDIALFSQFVRNYLTKYQRWSSPKYLFGESYGTFRSAGMVNYLQQSEGIFLNGVMLLGTVLDFSNISPSASNDPPYAMFLPTYTASAWYHKRLPAELQKLTLAQAVQQSRDFAFGDYLVTLAKGNTLTDAEFDAAAQKVARFTGLPLQFVKNTNLRVDAGAFRTELLRDKREMLGRYDTRLTGLQGNASSLNQDYDPSDVAPTGAFMQAFMRYVQDSLDYHTDLQYMLSGQTGQWVYGGGGRGGGGFGGSPTTSQDLRVAMSKDPRLRVWVGSGYYDSATPFANAEYTFRHLGYGKAYTDRVSYDYFESGHMAYLNQESARQLSDAIQKFVRGGR